MHTTKSHNVIIFIVMNFNLIFYYFILTNEYKRFTPRLLSQYCENNNHNN